MRNIVADFVWLDVTVAWMNHEWFKMAALINLCTACSRARLFWDIGGWQLAWNASIAVEEDVVSQPNPLRRLQGSRFWIDRGLDVYKRGIENNPEQLASSGQDTAMLYQQRLRRLSRRGRTTTSAPANCRARRFISSASPPSCTSNRAATIRAPTSAWKALWYAADPGAARGNSSTGRRRSSRNIRQAGEQT